MSASHIAALSVYLSVPNAGKTLPGSSRAQRERAEKKERFGDGCGERKIAPVGKFKLKEIFLR